MPHERPENHEFVLSANSTSHIRLVNDAGLQIAPHTTSPRRRAVAGPFLFHRNN